MWVLLHYIQDAYIRFTATAYAFAMTVLLAENVKRIFIRSMAKRTNKSSEGSIVSPSLAPFGAETKEEWKQLIIAGKEQPYLISNYGGVKTLITSSTHRPGGDIAQIADYKGYVNVVIKINGRISTMKVHRLVALMFVPNDLCLPEINHKDENKSNNRADNLEWCNRLYNVRYGTGRDRGVSKLKKELCQYDICGNLIKIWPSVKSAAKELDIDASCITRCACGKIKTYRDYIWLYKDDPNAEKMIQEKMIWLSNGNNRFYGDKRPVGAVDDSGRLRMIFPSARYAEKYGFKSSGICKSIKSGQRHYGYRWVFT